MKRVYIRYSVETETINARTYIVMSSATDFKYCLMRAKEYQGKTRHYRIMEYKTLAAAVRASRRWMHEVSQDEF